MILPNGIKRPFARTFALNKTYPSQTKMTYSEPSHSPSPTANPVLQRANARGSNSTLRGLDERRHITAVRTFGDRPPLFCMFPGPPGSIEFADLLPNDQPLYDFYFIKLDGSVSFPTVEQLASTFLKELRKVQSHGPYQLCGYSKAGLVAYETARMLLGEGEDVSFLALFETWHPGFERNLARGEYLRFRFLFLMDRFKRLGRSLFQAKFRDAASVLSKGISRRVKLAWWPIVRRYFGTQNEPIPQAMQQAESIVVLKSFVPKPFPKGFLLIRSDDPFETSLDDPTLGWRACATEGVEVHIVHGAQDHGSMMAKPQVRFVVDKIRPYLADPRTS
jgi:thioesterase domain-containing protein